MIRTSPSIRRAVLSALAAGLALAACSPKPVPIGPQRTSPRGGHGGSPTGSPGTLPSGSGPPTVIPRAEPLPLGDLTEEGGNDSMCPPGFTCHAFTVDCPGVERADPGFYAVSEIPDGAAGMAVFFNAGPGKRYWGEEQAPQDFLGSVVDAGLVVVEVRWQIPWQLAEPGEDAGPAALACRPATAIRFMHDTLYPDLGLTPEAGAGACGFCLVGSSSGASQVAYALTHYGLQDLVDAAVLTSGPVHGALAAGCLIGGGEGYGAYARVIDRAYGYANGEGPCRAHDPSWEERWLEDGVATGGASYDYPDTRVQFIAGERDHGVQGLAHPYFERLVASGTPEVGFAVIPGMGHGIKGSAEGLDSLLRALTTARVDNPG